MEVSAAAFEFYDEHTLKELVLNLSAQQCLRIREVRYDSGTQCHHALAQPMFLDEQDKFEKEERIRLETAALAGQWPCPQFYQADILRTFVHGPQNARRFIASGDYRMPGRAFPVMLVLIQNDLFIVPPLRVNH